MAKAKRKWVPSIGEVMQQQKAAKQKVAEEWYSYDTDTVKFDQAKSKLINEALAKQVEEMKKDMDAHIMASARVPDVSDMDDSDVLSAGSTMIKNAPIVTKTIAGSGAAGAIAGGNQRSAGWWNSPRLNPVVGWDNEHHAGRNIQVFKSIKDRMVIDIGLMGSTVCITFQDGGSLNIHPSSDCKLMEQNDLGQLNGQPLGDIAVNPQYSIAGEMTCMLICYSRLGSAVSFAVFGDHTPQFQLEYTHATQP